ncbi:diguanylate cyclase (GGDEF)-like protein/PAS domain S-box-containing protein [Sphingomonas sp. 1185]
MAACSMDGSDVDGGTALSRFCALARQLFAMPHAFVLLEEGGEYRLVAGSRGEDRDDERILHDEVMRRRAVKVLEVQEDGGTTAFRAAAPLMRADGGCAGVLALGDRGPRRWDARSSALLERLAADAAALWQREAESAATTARLRDQLAETRQELHELADHGAHARMLSRQMPWTADPNGSIREVDPRWLTLTGRTAEQILGEGWTSAVHPDDLPVIAAAWQRALSTGASTGVDARVRMQDGAYRWFNTRSAPRLGEDGSIYRWYGTIEDIHDRVMAEQALSESAAFTRNVLESTTDCVVVIDRDWRITYLNARASKFFRPFRAAAVGDAVWDRFAEYRKSDLAQRLKVAIGTGQPKRFEMHLSDPDIWLHIHACPVAEGLAIFFRNITKRIRDRERLVRLAHCDPLTGLANRTLFNQVLESAFAGRTERPVDVLMLDLDLFKEVNDTLGHPVGDAVLCAVAERFRSVMGEGDVLARLGGDEFAVIHWPDPAGGSAIALAHRLLACFAAPFPLEDTAIRLAASIGVASSVQAQGSANELFKSADIALYRAKEAGRGTIRVFDCPMAARVRDRQVMKYDLEAALSRDELRLVYQPLLDLKSGRITGAEALLRWHHPTRGEVLPADFVPLAEETGQIVAIGDWVVATACRDAVKWPGDATVAVNLSGVQLRDDLLPSRVLSALSRSGLAAERLELEITESILMSDSDGTMEKLHRLRRHGVRIALDDFGTGYSSLSYLRRFRFDKLKLDRCFVDDIGRSPQSDSIVRAACEMGRAFAMTMTAEGVQTPEQLEWLRAHGWSQAQGYLIARPLEADAFLRHMVAYNR